MRRIFFFLCLCLLTGAVAQTWCGKHYMSTQPVVEPGGNFPLPSPSSEPLLALQCAPAIRPYLAEDVSSPATILIDTPIVYYHIANAVPVRLSSASGAVAMLDVTVSLDDGRTLTTGAVPLNATAYELPFSLEGIAPRKAAYNLSCRATYTATSQEFVATTALSVLPNPTSGSVTKMDLRTGALLAKPATGLGGTYEPIFPIGFYTQFDDYLATNLSVIDELKEQGFTIIHPVPTFGNLTALDLVADRMQQAGLYLMYDMRWTYANSTSVAEQVNALKHRPNLLLWYTADEPDGTSDPFDATTSAYDLIYALDGYHPVSLVLNCQDYHWSSYAAGTDVIMQDAYVVGTNVTWSTEWNTSCTRDFGDCGCDNCASIAAGNTAAVPPDSAYYGAEDVPADSGIGTYVNIGERVASFRNRMETMGWGRSKVVWTVPQAFGSSQYWSRAPTGQEWVVQSIVAINHGALGVVPWLDPTPVDIKSAASAFAQSLPEMTPYLFDPVAVRTVHVVGGGGGVGGSGVSAATWKRGGVRTLVLVANTHYVNRTVNWGELGLGLGLGEVADLTTTTVFASGVVEIRLGGFTLGPVSSGAFVVGTGNWDWFRFQEFYDRMIMYL